MIRFAAAVVAIAIALAAPAAMGAPTVSSTTEYATYPVSGASPAELLGYMNRHPIIDPDDGPSYANITHEHDLDIGTLAMHGMCRVTKLKFTWHFVITTPVAANTLPPQTKVLWTTFTKTLRTHEEHHRAIFLDCGQDFVAAAGKLTGPASCARLEQDVRDFIDQAYAACMVRQRQFDADDHPHIMATPFMVEALLN